MKFKITESTTEQKRDYIKNLIESAGSQFITVEFTKKDGSNRVMNIQQAALKFHVKGEEASEAGKKAVATRKANHPELLSVYDVQIGEVRSINLDETHTVRVNRDTYEFA